MIQYLKDMFHMSDSYVHKYSTFFIPKQLLNEILFKYCIVYMIARNVETVLKHK